MTMNFIAVRDALESVLIAGAAGKYRVLSHQALAQSAESVVNNNRLVQVFYSTGQFPQNKSTSNGPLHHDMMFQIILTASKAASGDLDVINNLSATPLQLAAALAAMKLGETLVDDSMDELFNDICDVLRNAENIDLGLSESIIDNWLDNFRKEKPSYHGELVFIIGTIQFTCAMPEVFGGEASVSANLFDVEVEAYGIEDQTDPDTGKVGTLVTGA